jgi:hypothetical protein
LYGIYSIFERRGYAYIFKEIDFDAGETFKPVPNHDLELGQE